MNAKHTIALAVVRLLADNTNIIRKNDSLSEMISVVMTGKSQEERIAEQAVATIDEVVERAKVLKTRRQFSKITKNI